MAEALDTLAGGTASMGQYMRYRENIDVELERIRELWERRWTKPWIHEAVIRGLWQCWFFTKDEHIKVVVYTQVIDYPASRVLWVPLALGNGVDELLPLIEATLERFGQEMGCDECEITGRRGWERKLSHRFKAQGVLLWAPIAPSTMH